LTITAGSDAYKVHKNIVCERARFLTRAVKSGGQETQTGTIDLPEDEPELVKLFIKYIYEGEYEPALTADDLQAITTTVSSTKPEREQSSRPMTLYFLISVLVGTAECTTPPVTSIQGEAYQLLIHTKMYEIGDKYDVVGLMDLLKEKFNRPCKRFRTTLEFPAAAYHTFSTTIEANNGLRDPVSETISEHMELAEEPEVRILLKQFSGLAFGILDAKIKGHGWGKKK
ncbi:hypothetical protein BU25DRAFT_351346, partial [Macroventuria anomochaeta]